MDDVKTCNTDQALDLLARKLAFLIATSKANDEVKQDVINALALLNMEQIVDFINELEDKCAFSATSYLDDWAELQLLETAEELAEKKSALEEDTLLKLKALTADIN